jgi:hypothetical protein
LERTGARRSRREPELQREERRARLLRVRTFGDGHVRRPPGCREKPAENRRRGRARTHQVGEAVMFRFPRVGRPGCGLSGQPPRSGGVQRLVPKLGYRPLQALLPLALLVVAIAATLVPASERRVMRTEDPSGMVYTPTGPVELDRVRAKPCGNMRQGQGSLLQSLAFRPSTRSCLGRLDATFQVSGNCNGPSNGPEPGLVP